MPSHIAESRQPLWLWSQSAEFTAYPIDVPQIFSVENGDMERWAAQRTLWGCWVEENVCPPPSYAAVKAIPRRSGGITMIDSIALRRFEIFMYLYMLLNCGRRGGYQRLSRVDLAKRRYTQVMRIDISLNWRRIRRKSIPWLTSPVHSQLRDVQTGTQEYLTMHGVSASTIKAQDTGPPTTNLETSGPKGILGLLANFTLNALIQLTDFSF